MTEVKIRPARKSDLPRIRVFLNTVDKDFYPPLSEREPLDKMSADFLDNRHRCILMESGAEPEALMGVAVYVKPWKSKSDAFIKILAIHPNLRGQGLGKKLREDVLEMMRKDGVKEVYATTWSTNSRMIHINRKMGFKVQNIKKNDRGKGIHTILFRKVLKKRQG